MEKQDDRESKKCALQRCSFLVRVKNSDPALDQTWAGILQCTLSIPALCRALVFELYGVAIIW